MDVFVAPSPTSFPRLGVIVPKHGESIVRRNRLKRRLREIGRRSVLPGLAARELSMDVLVRARRAAYGATFVDLVKEVGEAVEALCSDAS